MDYHLRIHKKQFKQPFQYPECGREVDGRDAWEAHVLDLHTTKRRTPPPPPHDEREPDVVHDTGLVIGDRNVRYGSDNIFSDTADDTGLADIETWKLLGSLLSHVNSLGWSDSECLSWLRENVQAIQSGSPTGWVTKSGKRSAEEGLEKKIKRPKLAHALDDIDPDTTADKDGIMAAGDMDGGDDGIMDDDDVGSDWDADNSDCSSDTSGDDNKDDETLAAFFQELKERTASKMASRAATQNGPSATMSDSALSQEPPPPYTSAINSPLVAY